MALLETRALCKEYGVGEARVRALRGVDLVFEAGEYVSIVGPSGCGKSTLLYCLGLLVTPTGGSYRFDGKEVGTLSDAERSRIRGCSIGFVFQSFHLLPQRSVLDNVLMASRYVGGGGPDLRERARGLLDRVGLSGRLKHRPNELSNGEMQRAAIARALLMDPGVILADEPTGNLDERTGREIAELLESMHAGGKTLLVVTHNPELAARAQRTVALADGAVAA